jgi:hypothetical protein
VKRNTRQATRSRVFFYQEALNMCVPFMLRQAQHERNHGVAVRPELFEGLTQRIHKKPEAKKLIQNSIRGKPWSIHATVGEANLYPG